MALADASGVGRFRGRLTPGATPSLNLPTGDQHAVQQKNKASLCIPEGYDSQASDGNTAWTGSMVLASQPGNEESSHASETVCASPALLSPNASQHGNEESSHASETVRASPGFLSPDLDTTPPNILECMNCGCKQLKSTCSTEEKGTQYSPPKESRWTQTVLTKTRTTGTQANRNVAALQTSCTQTSEELCQTQLQDSGLPWQSMQTSCNRTSEEPHQANQQDTAVQWEPKRCSTPVMDVTESSIGDTENPADTTYVPSNDSVLSDRHQYRSVDPQEEPKYIVFESKLKELFRVCTTCLSPCTSSFSCVGSLLRVKCYCPDGHIFCWESQPYIANKPAGNVLLSAAILFSGASPIPTLRMLQLINVKAICDNTFFCYQRGYLLPAITEVWIQHQATLLVEMQGRRINLAADGRCDSPGHNAKYLSYNFYNWELNKVIHTVQVQSNEVASSYHMELEALKRGLEELKDFNVAVDTLTTDRHASVRKYMRTSYPTVKHQFDVWHVSKGIRKKLMSASKTKGCEALELWTKPVVNHLYFCVTHCEGDTEQALSMWKSLNNHACNVHEGHEGSYTRCLHPLLDDTKRPWLIPGSQPQKKLASITLSKYLLKDIPSLSPDVQTSSLEAFHSLLIRFAPKSVGYGPKTMKCRTYLAILHFNENSARAHAFTEDGELRYLLKRSKVYSGEYVALPIKEEPTFNYVHKLLKKVVELCDRWPTFDAAWAANPPEELPSLTSSQPPMDKQALIEARQHRLRPCACCLCCKTPGLNPV
ncbi:uncharacterized protein LOC135378751 [Ornithodoros turicata]|uniref:uncharacterized protein LOC135378751 n=1 Tax=Ornithodoros turicata TaxID=34597 RepID=UPI003139B2A7